MAHEYVSSNRNPDFQETMFIQEICLLAPVLWM